MKVLMIIMLALLAGAGLIWIADFEPGYVLIQYGNWSLETSLIVFGLMMLIVLLAGYILLRSWGYLRQVPTRMMLWKQMRRRQRASRSLTRGLIALEEGRWPDAERILVRHAAFSETPLLHYLAAARAAQKQGAYERRDNYLRLAHQSTAGADVAVGVVQAELQLAAGQQEQALATLQHLRDIAPRHPYVLQLLQQLYVDRHEWQDIQKVLPDLRKHHVLNAESADTLKEESWSGQLQAALDRQDWSMMSAVWQQIPTRKRQTEKMLKPYVSGLVQQGEQQQALDVIAQFLNRSWSDALVYQYGRIRSEDVLQQLAVAEKWLQRKADNPWLLLTLGRLAWEAQLWAKAENYLQASLDHGGGGEAYYLLAQTLRQQGEQVRANQLYEQGLLVMLEQTAGPE